MNDLTYNPFDLNRASDFSDSQIKEYWVDYGDGGLIGLIEPKSKTSIHLLGGKGSGKTHLMRYCSFPVQKLRHANSMISGLKQEGYIGVFSRANTLDTGRFKGKGQSDDKWGGLFNYYFEIRLCEQLISTLIDISDIETDLLLELDAAAKESTKLFDCEIDFEIDSLTSFHKALVNMRKEVDVAVNNCAFTRSLEITISVTPGNLLFGIPELVCKHAKELKDIQFLYLIDEIENFSSEKQEFINTLIRHRRGSCSFRIGARLYGIKTLRNYGSNEENKEGSEFKKVVLDKAMRSPSRSADVSEFFKRLCIKRLIDASIFDADNSEEILIEKLNSFFERNPSDNFYKEVTGNIVKDVKSKERKYFKRLFKQLNFSIGSLDELSVKTKQDINEIIDDLSCFDFPLLEKVNIFMFYKKWYQGNNLKDSSLEIKKGCSLFLNKLAGGEAHKQVYGHFSTDLLAQLYRDYSRPTTPMYAGLDSFIKMSSGVPRNLLVILHNVYKWARFNGEKPFGDAAISIESQSEAIIESSVFYYEEDARPGVEVPRIKESIGMLCEYLREVRYSSKPVEASPLTFSINETKLSAKSKLRLQQAENWSYIFQIDKGRPNANSQRVDAKYQLNPMLSPKWDLPISRRGDVRLSDGIADAIFGETPAKYGDMKKSYIVGLNAPKFGRSQTSNHNALELKFDNDDEL